VTILSLIAKKGRRKKSSPLRGAQSWAGTGTAGTEPTIPVPVKKAQGRTPVSGGKGVKEKKKKPLSGARPGTGRKKGKGPSQKTDSPLKKRGGKTRFTSPQRTPPKKGDKKQLRARRPRLRNKKKGARSRALKGGGRTANKKKGSLVVGEVRQDLKARGGKLLGGDGIEEGTPCTDAREKRKT